ncbi:MAG: hypothetical protein KC475_02565 [Cyanobacteria bacterium HKST-UBA03]|nr:hypothetical protein [Cyanobacteria bacterium HKST-UBA03]
MVLTEQDAKPQGTPLVLNWYANHLHIPHAPSASVVLSQASPDKHDFLNTNAFSHRHVPPRQTNAMWLSNWAVQGFDPVNFPLIFSQLFSKAIEKSEAKGYNGQVVSEAGHPQIMAFCSRLGFRLFYDKAHSQQIAKSRLSQLRAAYAGADPQKIQAALRTPYTPQHLYMILEADNVDRAKKQLSAMAQQRPKRSLLAADEQIQAMTNGVFETLFPDWPTVHFKQGRLGNCFQLSSYGGFFRGRANSIKQSMFQSRQDSEQFYVVFPGFPDIRLPVHRQEINPDVQSMADTGIQLLELAMAKLQLRLAQYGISTTPENSLRLIEACWATPMTAMNNTWRNKNKQGLPSAFVHYALTGNRPVVHSARTHLDRSAPLASDPDLVRRVQQFLHMIYRQPGHFIATAGSLSPSEESDMDLPLTTTGGIMLRRRHAFDVVGVTPHQRQLFLSDPHDPDHPIRLSYDDLFNTFSSFTLTPR